MSLPGSRRLVGLLLGVALVTAACGGGSSKTPRAGWPGSSDAGVADLLANVPADVDTDFLSIALYDRAVDLAGIELDDDPDPELARVAIFTGNEDGRVAMAPPTLLGRDVFSANLEDLLIAPSRIAAEIVVGTPPNQITLAFGDDLDDEILGDVEDWAEGEGEAGVGRAPMERRELADTEVVSWFDDDEVDFESIGPLGSMPNQAGRVAVPTDGVLVHTTNDDRMTTALETSAGDAGTLADDERFLAVADALDEAGVVAAFLTTNPIASVPNPERPNPVPEEGGLEPYDLLAVGGTVVDGRSEVVIVLHHLTDESAETNADLLRDAITTGTDLMTGRPWSEILDEPDVEVDGRITIVRATSGSTSLWSQLFLQQNFLLAVG